MTDEASGQETTEGVPDANEELAAELDGPEPEKAKPVRRGRWLGILTVVFLVAAVVLAVLLGSTLGTVNTVTAERDELAGQVTTLERNASSVASDLVDFAQQAADRAALQAGWGNHEWARAEIKTSRTYVDMANKLDRSAAQTQKQATVDKIKEVETALNPPPEPGTEAEGEPAPTGETPAAAPEAQAPQSPGPSPAPGGPGPGGPVGGGPVPGSPVPGGPMPAAPGPGGPGGPGGPMGAPPPR